MNERVSNDSTEKGIKNNLEKRTIFSASMSEKKREETLKKLHERTLSREELESIEKDLGNRMVLSLEEKQTIESYLNVAKEKLIALGIEEVEELLPSLDQIVFLRSNDKHPTYNGFITEEATLLVMVLGREQNIKDKMTQEIIFHELSHFINKFIFYKKKDGSFSNKQTGFNRHFVSDEHDKKQHYYSRGVYEEPLADFFTLYCMNEKDEVLTTCYMKENAFMILLLEEFAKRKGISSFEAFKRMFVAKVRMKLKLFQKEMVDIFKAEAVRGFNNLISSSSLGFDKYSIIEYSNLVDKIGLGKEYSILIEKIRRKQNIRFSGLPGSLSDY